MLWFLYSCNIVFIFTRALSFTTALDKNSRKPTLITLLYKFCKSTVCKTMVWIMMTANVCKISMFASKPLTENYRYFIMICEKWF